jgi:branched-chain amino acid transport system substrate-binding protein
MVIVFITSRKAAHMMKRFLVLLGAISLFIPSFAHGATKVKIGFVNSITGPEAPIGENLSNGVTLAVEDLKKEGIDVDLVKEGSHTGGLPSDLW